MSLLQYFKIWSDARPSLPHQLLAFGDEGSASPPRHAPRCFSNAKIALASLQDGFAAAHLAPGSKNTLALAIMHNFQLCCAQAVSACLRQSVENSNDLTAGHFAHLLVETACSYDYTSQISLPFLQTHLLLLQHLKTTFTASNLRHSLLLPSSSPAGMRSLSFMVTSLFVSLLTLSSASNQIHSYIFKLKKLPDPLAPMFTAATTITAKEDLSLVYEFEISYFLRPFTFQPCRHLRLSESSFGLKLSPVNLRCRSC
ncbi:hypothetical protein D6C81_10688 [Aureobasidium pullulans]|nr:hypothetical protein D6C81_10688 [Aureobasidium pullulans]